MLGEAAEYSAHLCGTTSTIRTPPIETQARREKSLPTKRNDLVNVRTTMLRSSGVFIRQLEKSRSVTARCFFWSDAAHMTHGFSRSRLIRSFLLHSLSDSPSSREPCPIHAALIHVSVANPEVLISEPLEEK